jgi:hypothetical protein
VRVDGSNEWFYVVVDTEAKGDCMPESLCISLNDDGNGTCMMDMATVRSTGRASVRAGIASQLFLPHHRPRVRLAIDPLRPHDVSDAAVEEYLRRVAMAGEWLGEVELEAAAEVFKRPIQVYGLITKGGEKLLARGMRAGSMFDGEPVHVLYEGFHRPLPGASTTRAARGRHVEKCAPPTLPSAPFC